MESDLIWAVNPCPDLINRFGTSGNVTFYFNFKILKELLSYSEQRIASSNVAKILRTFELHDWEKYMKENLHIECYFYLALTTIFSAASHIFSTLASDNPLIPVKFWKMQKSCKQKLQSSNSLNSGSSHFLCVHHQTVAGIDSCILKLLHISSINSVRNHCRKRAKFGI